VEVVLHEDYAVTPELATSTLISRLYSDLSLSPTTAKSTLPKDFPADWNAKHEKKRGIWSQVGEAQYQYSISIIY
jgi:hypothetical protein